MTRHAGNPKREPRVSATTQLSRDSPAENRRPGPPVPNPGAEKPLRPVTARLRCKKQSREALVRDDRNVPLGPRKHGPPSWALRRMLAQEREHFGAQTAPGLHCKRHKLRFRIRCRRVAKQLAPCSVRRSLTGCGSALEKLGRSLPRRSVDVSDVDVPRDPEVVDIPHVQPCFFRRHDGSPVGRVDERPAVVVLRLNRAAPLGDELLSFVHGREMALVPEPGTDPLLQPGVPPVKTATGATKRRVAAPRIGGAIGAREAVPANPERVSVQVETLLGWASLPRKLREKRR